MDEARLEAYLEVEGASLRRLRLSALVTIVFLPYVVSCDDTQPASGCEPSRIPASDPPPAAQYAHVWACAYAQPGDSVVVQTGGAVWGLQLGAARDLRIEGPDAGRVTGGGWYNPDPRVLEIIASSPVHARLVARGVGRTEAPYATACGFGDESCRTALLWILPGAGAQVCPDGGHRLKQIDVVRTP